MKNVVTIRLSAEYVGMVEHIKLSLQEQGVEVPDHILLRTLLLTGIRDVNLKIIHGENIFERYHERNQEADD